MEKESEYTVGDYLVERLEQLGLGHLFSIAGDYSIDWVNEYVRDKSRIKVIEEVNELNAGYAADGYARLKGIGALCVTYSAGALSAVNPIAGAYTERVPVVLINGAPSIKRTLTYEQTGFSSHHFISGRQTNLQVFEYITSAAVRIDNAALAPLQIDYALTQCITKRSPVYIELLQDVVGLECKRPPVYDLRLMSGLKSVDAMPDAGKELIIIADINSVLYFRAFRDDGEKVVDTDGTKLMNKAKTIETLREKLTHMWRLHACTKDEQRQIIQVVESIVGYVCKLWPAKMPTDSHSLQASLDQVKEQLEKRAKKPLLWVGVEVDRFGLQDQVKKLIRQLSIPYVTQFMSKAVLSEDDPLFGGVFDGQASSDAVKELAGPYKIVRKIDPKTGIETDVETGSDFILALGVWLTDINTLGWSPSDRRPDFDKTAFVSLDTVKYGTFFSAQVSLDELIKGLLEPKVNCKPQSLPPKPHAAAPKHLDHEPITYQGFYDFLADKDYICRNTIIGSDPSLNYFGSMHLRVGTEGGYVAQSSYSSIGYIGPAATGMSLAKPNRRVVVFTGDGGFQMTAACLSTQIRCGLNPIIFVINNGVFGVEQWLHNAAVFLEPHGKFSTSCEMHSWNYSKLSEVFDSAATTVEPSERPTALLGSEVIDSAATTVEPSGRPKAPAGTRIEGQKMICRGYKVRTYRQLQEAIEGEKEGAIFNTKGPSLIEVLVDRWSIPTNAEWKEKLDRPTKTG